MNGDVIVSEVVALVAEVAPHPLEFELSRLGVPCVVTRTDPCQTGRRLLGEQFALCDQCASAIAKATRLSPSARAVARPSSAAEWVATVTGATS